VENACYIDQFSDSGAEIADKQEHASAEWVIGNHISCCSKHASFDIPVYLSLANSVTTASTNAKWSHPIAPTSSFYDVAIGTLVGDARFPLDCRQVPFGKS
jgi:hypothetical protein